MFTMRMISFTVTTPSPLQSPTHPPEGNTAVGVGTGSDGLHFPPGALAMA